MIRNMTIKSKLCCSRLYIIIILNVIKCRLNLEVILWLNDMPLNIVLFFNMFIAHYVRPHQSYCLELSYWHFHSCKYLWALNLHPLRPISLHLKMDISLNLLKAKKAIMVDVKFNVCIFETTGTHIICTLNKISFEFGGSRNFDSAHHFYIPKDMQ